jgi:hypothetical protein
MTSCHFNAHPKDKKKREPASAHATICAPENYYDRGFQKWLLENRRQNQWIFDLIANDSCPGETVYHNASKWLLARDLHRGTDNRYLVIFKDHDLHSIRDLRADHIDLLKDIVVFLKKWLPAHEPAQHKKYLMYFHYMPSVFQLHMHVSMRKAPDSLRVHQVHNVLHNLSQRDTWYKHALILCPSTHPAKSRSVDHGKIS